MIFIVIFLLIVVGCLALMYVREKRMHKQARIVARKYRDKMDATFLHDPLTGVLNRVSYETRLENIEEEEFESLCCIYVDVNGLHEMNNHLGHDAGDEMLREVANSLEEEFPQQDVYRIGGDEFVVISKNSGNEETKEKMFVVEEQLAMQNYDISAGIEWRDSLVDSAQLVKEAEEKMRLNKAAYYENKGDRRKNREMNMQLEKMIKEKQDAEAFLSIIAPRFKGVYFVNLEKDSIRDIFIPPYFEEMLNRANRKFSQAIAFYGEEVVHEEDKQRFLDFCNYANLKKTFENEMLPEIRYRKPDESYMFLQVLHFKKHNENNKETLWIFTPEKEPVPDVVQEKEEKK